MSLTVELYSASSSLEESTQPYRTPTVLVGSVLEGCVSFTCHQTITGVQSFVTRLVGKESTSVQKTHTVTTETRRDGSANLSTIKGTKEVTRLYHSDQSIVQVFIPLGENNNGEEFRLVQKGDGCIHPGSYKMPFSVQIPEGLPSSMSFVDETNTKNHCSISYQIEAEILHKYVFSRKGTEEDVRLRTIRGAGLLAVISPSPMTKVVPYHGDPSIVNIRNCCFHKGQIALAAYVENTHVQHGQSIQVAVAVLNRSLAKVSAVRAHICQCMEWKAKSQKVFKFKSLSSASILVESGSEKGVKGVIDEAIDIPILKEGLRNLTNSMSVQLPLDAKETYDRNGQSIRISYELSIKVDSGNIFRDDAEITIPIQSKTPATSSLAKALERTKVLPPAAKSTDAASKSPNVFAVAVADSVNVRASNFDLGGTSDSPPCGTTADSPSFQKLLADMEPFDVTDLIKERAKDPTWQAILARLTPLQYALVLQAVQNTSKTPEIAEVIATLVSRANTFQCDHVVEFLKNVDGWYRTSIAESLLPYCNDLTTTQNKGKVLAVLSDWDGCWRDSATRNMIKGLLDGTWCTPTSY